MSLEPPPCSRYRRPCSRPGFLVQALWLVCCALLNATSMAVVVMPSERERTTSGPRQAVMIMHLRRHGLCNRLRSLASAAIMATDMGLPPLRVDWEPEGSCNARMEDLFDSGKGVAILKQPTIEQFAGIDSQHYAFLNGEGDASTDLARHPSMRNWLVQNRQVEQLTRFRRMLSTVPVALESLGIGLGTDASPAISHLLYHSAHAMMRVLTVHKSLQRWQGRFPGTSAAEVSAFAKQRTRRRRHRFTATETLDEYVSEFGDGRLRDTAAVNAPQAATEVRSTEGEGGGELLMIHFSSDTPNVPPHLPCRTYFRRKRDFYRSLVPVAAVQRAVHAIWRPLAGLGDTDAQRWNLSSKLPRRRDRPVIGLHARVHDPVHDYAVVPGSGGKVHFGDQQSSSLEGFIEAAQKLQKGQPDAVVFLATNDCTGRVVTAMRQALKPGSVFTSAEILSEYAAANGDEEIGCIASSYCAKETVETEDGYQLPVSSRGRGICDARGALVDLLVLSQADLILGSYWSSFTEEAAAFHLTPLLTITLGNVLTSIPTPDGGGWPDEFLYYPDSDGSSNATHGDEHDSDKHEGSARDKAVFANVTDDDIIKRLGMPDTWVPQSSLTCGYPPFINRHLVEKARWSATAATSSENREGESEFFVSKPVRSLPGPHGKGSSQLPFESGYCATPTMWEVQNKWGLEDTHIFCITE